MHAFQSLWILLATMLFAVMAVFVKVAAEHFGVLELVFYRSAISGVILLAIAKVWKKTLRTGNFRTHFWRGITGFLSLTLFFFALPRLNLSTVTALLQTSPLFLALLTAFFLRERISSPLLVALLVSFVGMLFVLRPGLGGEELLGGIAALVSGLMSGFAYFNIRRLGILNEGGIRTVFYFVAFSAVFSLLLIVGYGDFSPLSGIGALLLLAIAATATGGQLALTRGLHYGHTLTASALIYSGVIFSGVLDYAIWQSAPDALSWFGIALIVAGGVFGLS